MHSTVSRVEFRRGTGILLDTRSENPNLDLMTGIEVGGSSVLAKEELVGSVSLIQAVEGMLKRTDLP